MKDTTIHQKIITTPYKGKTTITCKLHQLGDQSPYFSFTTDNGCDHERIAKAAPDVVKFLPLHRRSPEGIPMYFVENGVYHYEQGDAEALKSHLVCDDEFISRLVEKLSLFQFREYGKIEERVHADYRNAKKVIDPLISDWDFGRLRTFDDLSEFSKKLINLCQNDLVFPNWFADKAGYADLIQKPARKGSLIHTLKKVEWSQAAGIGLLRGGIEPVVAKLSEFV
ncbi:MAG: hypothetical protein KDD43_13100, partial [Bdellovibrionales bacterium]|nr:hypothetical protein [Bdellovibrionales bacterium]